VERWDEQMRLIDLGLEKLTDTLIQMSNISVRAIELAAEAFMKGIDVSKKVYELSLQLKELHEAVTDIATELIARYQPLATDLRYIKSCYEISYGFYRFGRYAYDIADIIREFGDISYCGMTEVRYTVELVKKLVNESIASFKEKDPEKAKKVIELDDEVDAQYRNYLRKAISDTTTDKKCDLAVLLLMRYLERIGDHATYIAETVLYITGKASSEKPS
jgi:phosphate transport system protein